MRKTFRKRFDRKDWRHIAISHLLVLAINLEYKDIKKYYRKRVLGENYGEQTN